MLLQILNDILSLWYLLLGGVVLGFLVCMILASVSHKRGPEHKFNDPERDRVIGIVQSMEKKE